MLRILAVVQADSSCEHPDSPKLSLCEGCPPTYNGLLCASTTWYNDLTKVLNPIILPIALAFCVCLKYNIHHSHLRVHVAVVLNLIPQTSGPRQR